MLSIYLPEVIRCYSDIRMHLILDCIEGASFAKDVQYFVNTASCLAWGKTWENWGKLTTISVAHQPYLKYIKWRVFFLYALDWPKNSFHLLNIYSTEFGGHNLTNIIYTDAKVLIAGTETKLQKHVQKLAKGIEKKGLSIIYKTECMVISNWMSPKRRIANWGY